MILCLALLIAGFLIIHSCKKDGSKTQSALTVPAISMAKQWYEATYPATIANANKLNTQSINPSKNWANIFSPYWDKAVTYESNGLTFVETPALKKGNMAFSSLKMDPSKFNFSNSNSVTSLLIIKQPNGFGVYAMTIMGDSAYINGNYNKLKNNTYRNRAKDFSGYVFYHKLDGTFVNGWRYVNGKVTTAVYKVSQTSSGSQLAVQNVNKQKVNLYDCETTIITEYWEDCAMGDDGPFDCYYYTTEDDYTSCDPSPGSGGGSPSPPPPCQVGNAMSGSKKTVDYVQNPPPPVDPPNPTGPIVIPQGTTTSNCADGSENISNNLKNPCAHQVLDDLTNDDLTGQIADIIQNVFGSNANVNLDFEESATTQGNAPATSNIPQVSNGTYNETITLNSGQINGASQEYIASLMIHEVLHAYLNYNQTYYQQQYLQHQNIAQNYLTSVRNLLQQEYDISDDDANSLILEGMSDLKGTPFYNSILQSVHLTDGMVQTNALFEKEGLSGTKCP